MRIILAKKRTQITKINNSSSGCSTQMMNEMVITNKCKKELYEMREQKQHRRYETVTKNELLNTVEDSLHTDIKGISTT